MSKGKELLMLAEAIANERDIDQEIVMGAIEEGLAKAIKKYLNNQHEIQIVVDWDSGEYAVFSIKTVVDTEYLEEHDCLFSSLEHIMSNDPSIENKYPVGHVIKTAIPTPPNKRISAQYARGSIFQKIREIEHQKIARVYSERVGETVSCVFSRYSRLDAIVDLGDGVEAIIPKNHLLFGETFKTNMRFRACIHDVSYDHGFLRICLSRTSSEFLVGLFKVEVPEINEGLIEINKVGREPGIRSKVMVSTLSPKVDAIGSCVGIRGSRIHVISKELNGERIDVLEYSSDLLECVKRALKPAEPLFVSMNEEKNAIEVVLKEDQLSMAIGKNGQNVRLVRQLAGMHVNLFSEEQQTNNLNQKNYSLVQEMSNDLEIPEDWAQIFVASDLKTLDEIADTSSENLSRLLGIEISEAEEVTEKAQNLLLQKAFGEVQDSIDSIESDLLELGVSSELFQSLKMQNIHTIEDLADLSTAELQQVVEIGSKLAGDMIMCARSKSGII